MTTSITLSQEKYITSTGYIVRNEIDSSTPSSLKNCFIINPATETQRDRFVRVATLQDIETYAEEHINIFYVGNGALEDAEAGDTINITNKPEHWHYTGYVEAEATILHVATGGNWVKVISPDQFPCSDTELTWEIKRGGIIQYTSTSDTLGQTVRQKTASYFDEQIEEIPYVKTDYFINILSDIDTAVGHLSIVQSGVSLLQAESETKESTFTGEDIYTYD